MQKNLSLRRRRRRGVAFLMVVMLVVLGGIVLWALSVRNVLPESWWTAVGATFTVAGVILAFMQLVPKRGGGVGKTFSPTLVSSGRKGTLIVRTGGQLCGSTVELCSGFKATSQCVDFAANIVERRTDGIVEYVGVFPSLESGNYTARVDGSDFVARVTVSGGRTAEIDWRRFHGVTSR